MTVALRAPIAESWRRAELAGLEPESALDRIDQQKVDRDSPLLTAARPVLQKLADDLAGSKFSTLLVDREARLAHLWSGDSAVRSSLDSLGVDVGTCLLEDVVGTNAPGTVLETRRSITVNGDEHFARKLRNFSCYGHPIFHPVTRRIEGVLDLSTLTQHAHPLVAPLVARAVAEIEQRLLDRSRASDAQLLRAFQSAGGRRRAVVAVGHDVLMSNQAALDLLTSTDLALLRMIVAEMGDRTSTDLMLQSGVRARVRAARVTRGGVLLDIEPEAQQPATPVTRVRQNAPILIDGPPGSGRSTHARSAATEQPVTVLTAAGALLDGSEAWAADFAARVRSGQGTLVVDGLDLLPENLIAMIGDHIAGRADPQLILVTGPSDGLTGRAAALAGQCVDRRSTAPLAHRLGELPQLVQTMLSTVGADPSLHLTPGALRALACHTWPGNLRELRSVIEYVVEHRRTGGAVIDDLPEAYRSLEPIRPLAPIDRAERDAIVAALHDCGGNKVRAAGQLGISRTTLYAKMRALRITRY